MRHDQILPRHRPYRHGQALFQIGLQPMSMPSWLETGSDHSSFMAAKRARLSGSPPLYYRSLEHSLAAQRELLDAVLANLTTFHAASFQLTDNVLTDLIDDSHHEVAGQSREPLERLGNTLEEDFVLFLNDGGRDIVVAVSNAYTSFGRIVSCVGRDMHFAHEPVPGLNAQLGARIDRVIGNIQPEKPVVRFNWFITPISSRLFPEISHQANAEAAKAAGLALAADATRCGDVLWLRVERQTFVRLPKTGALAFGIHTYSDPLSAIAHDRDSLSAIHRLLGEYSKERLAYASMLDTCDPVRRWIERQLASIDSTGR
jgi:hypothetical protein